MNDPFRNQSYRRLTTRLASSLAQQGGLAVSRLDGRGFSLRAQLPWHFCLENRALFRGPSTCSGQAFRPAQGRPIPRIRGLFAGHYCRLVAAGPHETTQGELSSRMAALTTGGDLNPTCLGLLGPLVSGGLVAGRRSRRTRTWLLRTADSHRTGLFCQEPFPISPSDFSSDDRRKYIRAARKIPKKQCCATGGAGSYPPPIVKCMVAGTLECA
jgi:hypothetical protein